MLIGAAFGEHDPATVVSCAGQQVALQDSNSTNKQVKEEILVRKIGITLASVLVSFILVVPASHAQLDWKYMGETEGVEIYQTRTTGLGGGTIRILFENTNDYPVRIKVSGVNIWCGGTTAGSGEHQETYISNFKLNAGKRYASPSWNHYGCPKKPYYLEIQEVSVERRQ